MTPIASFVAELRRRRVLRAAAAYLVAAWLLVQVAATTFPLLELPNWAARAVLIVLVLGFPVAMVLAWAFDLTARGLDATPDVATRAGARAYGSLPVIAVVTLLVGSGLGAFFALGSLRTAPALDKAIAVLPFENLSGRAEDAYLADGLQEEILNALARVRDLKVISRTSVMEYRGKAHNVREIGQRLGVGVVLEGSIRRERDRLRLTVQLVDARDDRHLLAANYDRDLTQVLDLQSAVARQVADALSATLSRYERGELDRIATNNGDAYDRYLRAVALYRRPVPDDPEGLHGPQRLLEEALGFDPDYADALALLSQVHTWKYFFDKTNQTADAATAKRAFERASEIDPALPEARLARGLYAMYVTRDLAAALADLGAVVAVRPNSAEAHALLGFALRRSARFEEALAHQELAWELDPLNPKFGLAITTHLGLRRYADAIRETELFSTRFPNSPDGYFARARLQAWQQRSTAPLQALLRERGTLLGADGRGAMAAIIAQLDGRYADAVALWAKVPTTDPLARGLRVGMLHHAAGDAANAARVWRETERYALELRGRGISAFDLMQLAMVQSMLGEHEAALATIERAREEMPESRDAINGPQASFVRSVVLVRAGRSKEGYAEVERLLRVPFGAPADFFEAPDPIRLAMKDDPRFDEILNRPPRL